jgi:hypothetical protein
MSIGLRGQNGGGKAEKKEKSDAKASDFFGVSSGA